MYILITLLYNLVVIPVLGVIYAVLALGSEKVRHRWTNDHLSLRALDTLQAHTQRFWFHAASMGEFEQLKSIVEGTRKQWPQAHIIVSFSSSSGFRHQQHYAFADAVVYAPFDAAWRVREFLDRLNPGMLIVSRYDLWWNMMQACKRRQLPVLLVNATYTRSGFLRSPLGSSYYRHLLNCCRAIFTVNDTEYKSFHALGSDAELISGRDTRYDRLAGVPGKQAERRLEWRRDERTVFQPDDFILILGSIWKADLELLLHPECLAVLGSTTRLLIVPHEMNDQLFHDIDNAIGPCMRWSSCMQENVLKTRHCIVDSVGQLLSLYAIADAAYVGGGFGAGVHSVAEAACYGVVVACGPRLEHNADAVTLLHNGGLHCLKTVADAVEWLQYVHNQTAIAAPARMNAEYIQLKIGASTEVLQYMSKLLYTSNP